jgi:hypothetical protein
VSISRDCKFLHTEFSYPDIWGNKICNDLYDCKWQHIQ